MVTSRSPNDPDFFYFEDHLDNQDQEKQKNAKLQTQPLGPKKLAVIAAIELLYPHEFRAADVHLIADRKTTQKAIALRFHVPEYVIGSALHRGESSLPRLDGRW